jgi:hypothetical protein
MKNLFTLFIFAGLIYVINLSGFTSEQFNKDQTSFSSPGGTADIEIKVLYAKGSVPIKKGMPDTLGINLRRNSPSPDLNLRIRVRIFNTGYETNIYLNPCNFIDTLLQVPIPIKTTVQDNRIVVEALPGSKDHQTDYQTDQSLLLIDTIYSTMEYCQNITYDTYNYADPCLPDTAGFGFTGRKGSFVAGFTNLDSLPFLINSVEQKFFDSIGGGGYPYNIVIHADDGFGKPGALLYKSPNLTTPAGTGSAVTLPPYPIDTAVTIAGGNRFYIGYRQTSNNNIKAAYQNEDPIRDNSFFFTTDTVSAFWWDFSDSLRTNRLDISPIVSNSELKITYIMEGFYNSAADNLNMSDTLTVFLRNSTSPYAIIDSAKGKIDSINFVKIFPMNNAVTGSYYVTVKHRNTIETWSNVAVSFTKGGKTSYSFITAATQAYGNNMTQVKISPVRYAAYSGDVTQDGFVDLSDVTDIFNDAFSYTSGYKVTDITGNDDTDLSDIVICMNNASLSVSKITP